MSRLMAIVAAGVVLVAIGLVVLRSNAASELPVSGEVPDFRLVSSSGAPMSRADLDGKVWVADFIFTQCPGMCPILSGEMKRVQAALAEQGDSEVRLVSISVDPHNDTPEALRAYAERYNADPQRWLFLTGERDALYRLIGDGFRLAVAERSPEENTDGEGLITHSDRFVLVDRQQRIRGYYRGTDRASIDQLVADIERLRN